MYVYILTSTYEACYTACFANYSDGQQGSIA